MILLESGADMGIDRGKRFDINQNEAGRPLDLRVTEFATAQHFHRSGLLMLISMGGLSEADLSGRQS